jgi:periplasmic protein TonB
MKRNEKKVPEFDEIIFENRNKNYGAYDLRKSYKSVTSLSILAGVFIGAILMTVLSFTIKDEPAPAKPIDVILILEDPIIPNLVSPPEIKPPAGLPDAIKNLPPVVTDDTTLITAYIPTTDELNNTSTNGNVNDTVIYIEPTDPVVPIDDTPRIFVDEMPEFPGGNIELLRFIGENLNYPAEASDNNIQGRVILKFAVNTDGSVDRVEIIKGVDNSLNNEAMMVVMTLPRFKPGKQNGVAVPVWFTLPVIFQLKNN